MTQEKRFNPEAELGEKDDCCEPGCECQTDTDDMERPEDDLNKYPEKPKTAMSRSEVYHLINEERDYQDKKWTVYDDSSWSISDWVVFIRRYLKLIDTWTGHPREQMDEMRKVAALAVACMEFNGARSRNGEFSK